MFKLKKHNRSTGQALVEFAIMAVVLMMIIFIIIEAARILWAWGSVQNAAREGARYAITGQYDWPDCAVSSLPKFNTPEYCDDLRVASVISRTHTGLAGLPLNETSGLFEDDDYYQIEVWGVNQGGALQKNFAGIPNMPVIVRAYYRVPIISPFFSPILPSIPVFGQVTMYNETFGQLGGGSNQGAALPPPIPAIPTAGVTPSPTFTPTPDPSTATPTKAPTNTPTSTPDFCRVHFEGAAVQGNEYVYVTGEVGTLVRIVDLTQGGKEISAVHTVAGPFDNHLCPGFVTVFLTETLQHGHEIAVESSDTSVDITSVLPGTPTPTATNTPSVTPTDVATLTPTPPSPTPSQTPRNPYIVVFPTCGSPDTNGKVRITVLGYNWPDDKDIAIYWNIKGNTRSLISKGHEGNFSLTWLENEVELPNNISNPNSYKVLAIASDVTPAEATYQVPCDNATVVPTSTATVTPTPNPADLIIVGPPQLVSGGDVIGYLPVDFSMVISNTGDIDVDNQFFIDLYLDPAGPIDPNAERIPIEQSSGYAGVSSLPGNTSRVITITAPFGFANQPEDHEVYGMVDSIEQIQEEYETNNISAMATADYVTPGVPPTPSPTPDTSGHNNIIGYVNWSSQDGFEYLSRAYVYLYKSGLLVNFTRADSDGFYQFLNVPDGDYTAIACGNLDVDRSGSRTNIVLPSVLPAYSIYTDPVPCP